VRHGPVRIFVRDMDKETAFYTDVMGMRLTEEVVYKGHTCRFFRVNDEHHSLALYPIALRQELGLRPDSTTLSFGLQLGNYRQLKDGIAFLKEKGCKLIDLPQELYPGIDYSSFLVDPDGNLMQLYWYMERLSWDGKPRPKSQRRKVQPGVWPDVLEPVPDVYEGEAFPGPWG
jgi:catechol 2,3-dioxygenase-like lactoylglutathione lyase family enzyme